MAVRVEWSAMPGEHYVDAVLYVLSDEEWHMINKLHNESGLHGRFYGILEGMFKAGMIESTSDGLTRLYRLSDRGKTALHEFEPCPHGSCNHAEVVHADDGTCAMCRSKQRYGEPGEHPCAGTAG
jgi:DNA-binding PadR family transcriptional regulator